MINKDPRTKIKCIRCGMMINKKVYDVIYDKEAADLCMNCSLKVWIEEFKPNI